MGQWPSADHDRLTPLRYDGLEYALCPLPHASGPIGMVGGRRDRRAMEAHRGEMMATVYSIS
jgi:hypothetical protein